MRLFFVKAGYYFLATFGILTGICLTLSFFLPETHIISMLGKKLSMTGLMCIFAALFIQSTLKNKKVKS